MIKHKILFGLFPPILVVLPALPLMATGFLNDDIQILQAVFEMGNGNLSDIFISPHVWKHYWRPVHVLLIKFVGLLGGFNPLFFRITGLILYILVLFLVFSVLRISGINEKKAFALTLFFSLLPSHELNIAWIADQSELLAAVFLLSALYIYIGYIIQPQCTQKNLFYLFVTLAFLSKEIAITSFLIPFAALLIVGNITGASLKITSIDSLKTAIIIATVLLYRILIVGATPFSSPHISDLSLSNLVKNLFLYIPFSFLSPEVAQLAAEYLGLFVLLLIGAVFLFGSIYFLIKMNKSKLPVLKIFGGLFWFLAFIIPVTPVFMRWYAFIPSLGFIIAIAFCINEIHFGKLFRYAFFLIILLLSIHNASIWKNWLMAGKRMTKIAESLKTLNIPPHKETLIVWGIPDKINRVPVMKLGVKETFSFYTNTQVNIESPLRSEIFSDKIFSVKYEINDSSLTFYLPYGRFLPKQGSSSSFMKNEKIEFQWDGFKINITNNNTGAIAKITGKVRKETMFYFNGSGISSLN